MILHSIESPHGANYIFYGAAAVAGELSGQGVGRRVRDGANHVDCGPVSDPGCVRL